MLDFKDIQSTAVATIAARALFADQLVVANDGTKTKAIGNALGPSEDENAPAKGFAIVVNMPAGGEIERATKGVAIINADFTVWALSNPDVNNADGGAGIDLLEGVQEIVAALTDYSDDANDHFEMFQTPQLIETTDGYLGYELSFRKTVALS